MVAAVGNHVGAMFLLGNVFTPRGVGDERVMSFYGIDTNQPSPGCN
jgi:hypothetical protein